jgi:hypothetical protein
MVDREDARLHRLTTQVTQTEPSVSTVEVQTEFLTAPLELKTIVSNKLTKAGLKKYPMVFAQGLEYLAADDIDPNATMDAAAYISEISRPGTGQGGSRSGSRGGSRLGTGRQMQTIADLSLKDGPSAAPRFTLDDFFPQMEGNDRLFRESSQLKENRLTREGSKNISFPKLELPQFHPPGRTESPLAYINPMTTGVLSRRQSTDSLSISMSTVQPVPPAIRYESDQDLERDYVQRIEQLPSRQQQFEVMVRENSNAGLSKIHVASPPIHFPQNSSTDASNTPRSVHSVDSANTTSSMKIKKGVNAKFNPRRNRSGSHDDDVVNDLSVPVKSYRSPSKSIFPDDELDSMSPPNLSLPDQRSFQTLRNQVSNAYQDVVNGIVYNHKSTSDYPNIRTESAKLTAKEQEIDVLREPIKIKSYNKSNKSNNGLQRPRQADSPTQKIFVGKTPTVLDDTAFDSQPLSSRGNKLMSSSLSQAGLSTLNNESMKKMKKEFLR